MQARPTLAAIVIVALGLAACAPGDSAVERATVSAVSARNGEIPTFSHPTRITNRYLPFAQGGRWIYEGTKNGYPYLIENAVTDDTKTIEWKNNSMETLVVRHRGWVDGVLIEEALDYYAQGDDGGVWDFGEDVDNFKAASS
jgi:hypothetical protein